MYIQVGSYYVDGHDRFDITAIENGLFKVESQFLATEWLPLDRLTSPPWGEWENLSPSPPLTDWKSYPDGLFGRETWVRCSATNPDDIAVLVRGKDSAWRAHAYTPDLGEVTDPDQGLVCQVGSLEDAKEFADKQWETYWAMKAAPEFTPGFKKPHWKEDSPQAQLVALLEPLLNAPDWGEIAPRVRDALEILGLDNLDYWPNDVYGHNSPGDEAKCACGHSYYRHFDPFEKMEAVGCKYCSCPTWHPPGTKLEDE